MTRRFRSECRVFWRSRLAISWASPTGGLPQPAARQKQCVSRHWPPERSSQTRSIGLPSCGWESPISRRAKKTPLGTVFGLSRRRSKRPYNYPLSTGNCDCQASEEESTNNRFRWAVLSNPSYRVGTLSAQPYTKLTQGVRRVLNVLCVTLSALLQQPVGLKCATGC